MQKTKKFAPIGLPALLALSAVGGGIALPVLAAKTKAVQPAQPAARITPAAARAVALRAKPGTVTSVVLESEGGRAVYSVRVTARNGQKFDVKVDGVSGRVLSTEADDGEQNDGADDGETNDDNVTVTARITPAAARATALRAKPGTVTKIELESENGQPVYAVDITASGGQKFDVKVHGNTGRVLRIEADNDTEANDSDNDGESNDDNDAPAPAPRITLGAARATALRAYPGTLTGSELENEDGRAVYGIHITASNGRKLDVKVDGTTGRILRAEPDDGEQNDGPDSETSG